MIFRDMLIILGVISPIPAMSHTYLDIDHEVQMHFYGHSPPSADSRRGVVSYKLKRLDL